MLSRTWPAAKTEILVIGSGAIGSVFARLLIDAGHEVTMIDAGPILSDPAGDHLRNAAARQASPDGFGDLVGSSLQPISVAREDGSAARGAQNPEQGARHNLRAASSLYAVGGMLTQWSCVIPRPRGEQLLDEIPAHELSGLYSIAESLFGYRADLTVKDPVDSVLAMHLTDAGYEVESLPLAARVSTETGNICYTGAAQVLGDAARSPRFKLLPQHLCRELRWKRRAGRLVVESAIVVDLQRGQELVIAAEAVIVACNAILTPQLLYASHIWRDRLPALGRFLTEHPKFFGQVRMKAELVQRISAHNSQNARHDNPIVGVPAPSLTIPPHGRGGRTWHTQITRDPMHPTARPAGIPPEEIIQLRWFAPCEARRANEVRYAQRRTDAFGMPQPTFDFSLSSRDRQVVKAMIADCREVTHSLGSFIPGFEGRLQPPGHSLHMAGTFRIGTDPNMAVCDPSSKVWGFENLYLGGNGTIPNAHSVNPTLTAAAIGVRGALELSAKLGGSRLGDLG